MVCSAGELVGNWRHSLSREPAPRFKAIPTYKMVADEYAKTQANNLSLTLRERLWWLAMWQAKPNGHATFESGQIARILAATDRGIRKARADAVAAGYLHPMSDAHCLVLPSHAVGNGRNGSDKPCAHCMGHTPEPRTFVVIRDHDSESIDGESYRRDVKVQASAVLPERSVPVSGTNHSSKRETVTV